MKFFYIDVTCSTTKALPPLSVGQVFMATPSAAGAEGAEGAGGAERAKGYSIGIFVSLLVIL